MVDFNVTIIDHNFIETSVGMLSIVACDSQVVIDSNADTATVTMMDETDSKFLPYEKYKLLYIYIYIIAVTIGFNRSIYTV